MNDDHDLSHKTILGCTCWQIQEPTIFGAYLRVSFILWVQLMCILVIDFSGVQKTLKTVICYAYAHPHVLLDVISSPTCKY